MLGRRHLRWVVGSGLWLVLAAGAAHAQPAGIMGSGAIQAQEPRATALVTGHVTCSDTQRAARFATVMLVAAEQVSNSPRGFGRRVMGRTDLQGNFSVQAEPGDYYVTASATGYAGTVAQTAARLPSGASSADLLASLPQVHVGEGSGGTVNLTIDRGAVISGRLQWDDGSPAAGVNVNAMSTTLGPSNGEVNGQSEINRIVMQLGGGFGGGFQNTDDRGVFRINGLAPGSYWVRANVMTPSSDPPRRGMGEMMTSVAFYAPGKVRRNEAQVITIKGGEERDDVMFTLDLASLHTVSGRVGGNDGDNVASGFVRVADSQDSSFSRQAQIQPDGSFMLQWVPSGSYTLSVSNASNLPPPAFGPRGQVAADSSNRLRFQSFQESLTVTDTDISGLGISLTPETATASTP